MSPRPSSAYRPLSQASIKLIDQTTSTPRARTDTANSRTGLLDQKRAAIPSFHDEVDLEGSRAGGSESESDEGEEHDIGRGEGDSRDAGHEYAGQRGWEDMSVREKKNFMINEELDRMNEHGLGGLGRYQWAIFFLCGFGYFLDLCWAQAFGLIAGPLKQELGISDARIGDIYVAFSAGLTIGAFGWGMAVDVIGRKPCFNITCLISSIFGLMLALPSNFAVICLITALIGVGVGGNIPIDATIVLEFLPSNRRFLLAMLSTFQPLGVITSSGLAYFLVPVYSCDPMLPACGMGDGLCCERRDNMGWRYLMFTLGLITLSIFLVRFALFTFHESPKFLLTQGNDEAAIRVIYDIAKFNNALVPSLTIEDFRALDKSVEAEGDVDEDTGDDEKREGKGGPLADFFSKFVHLKELFATGRAIWLSSSIALAYMSLFASFSISGGYLPLLLRQRGIETDLPMQETYKNYLIVYTPGILATLLAGALIQIPRLGRKYAMVLSALAMAFSLFSFSLVHSVSAFVAFSALQYFFQSMTGALLYAITPDSFPASIRGSACGFASTVGRLAGTAAPLVAGMIYDPSTNSVVYLAGAAALVCSLSIMTLPSHSGNRA